MQDNKPSQSGKNVGVISDTDLTFILHVQNMTKVFFTILRT